MAYEGSLHLQKYLKEAVITEKVTIEWAQTKRDNPQSFETTYKAKKVTLKWYKGDSMKKGGTMHIKAISWASGRKVADLVAKQFAGQRIITLNGKVFSTKVKGFKDRGPDDYTTYRPGWKKDWTFTV